MTHHVHSLINNHTANHVGVEVRLIVDNGENLSVDSNSIGNVLSSQSSKGISIQVAENTIIERSLVLVHSATSSSGRMGPVDLRERSG